MLCTRSWSRASKAYGHSEERLNWLGPVQRPAEPKTYGKSRVSFFDTEPFRIGTAADNEEHHRA